MFHVLCVLHLHAGVVEALWSVCWWVWCLLMDGEGRKQWVMCVDDGGYMEGCGFRIWTEFPLTKFADILSRKVVRLCIYNMKYLGRGKALWSTWLNTLHYCQYDPEVECSIPAGVFFHILYINNNSDKLLVLPEVLVMPHIFLPDSGHSSEFQCHSSGIYQPKFHSCHGVLIFW